MLVFWKWKMPFVFILNKKKDAAAFRLVIRAFWHCGKSDKEYKHWLPKQKECLQTCTKIVYKSVVFYEYVITLVYSNTLIIKAMHSLSCIWCLCVLTSPPLFLRVTVFFFIWYLTSLTFKNQKLHFNLLHCLKNITWGWFYSWWRWWWMEWIKSFRLNFVKYKNETI